jgi:uncharacterized membrane protein YfcA
MIILEIALTIAAWRKGWRLRALVPLASAITVGFLMGAAVGAAGGAIDNVMPLFFVTELVCLGALIVMANRTPINARVPKGIEESALVETAPETAHS